MEHTKSCKADEKDCFSLSFLESFRPRSRFKASGQVAHQAEKGEPDKKDSSASSKFSFAEFGISIFDY